MQGGSWLSVFFTKFYGGYFTLESKLHWSGAGRESRLLAIWKLMFVCATYLALGKRCQVSGVRVEKLEELKPEHWHLTIELNNQ